MEGLNIKIQTEVPYGRKNIGRLFSLSKEQIEKYINKSLRASCRVIRDYARKHHRYEDNPARQKREGNIGLTRAIHFRVIDRIKRGEVYINEKEAPYGKYQVGGTHSPITPRRAKYLSFFSDRYGKFYRLASVKGIKKDDFIHDAYKENRSTVKRIFRDYLRGLIDVKL